MKIAPLEASGAVPLGSQPTGSAARVRVAAGRAVACLIAGACLFLASPAYPTPYIWDDDGDGIDDRIETVHLLGFTFSFEGADSLARQRIAVSREAGVLLYSVYVIFDHPPTSSDFMSLRALGISVLYRYEAADAVRSLASFPQIEAAAALPGVKRVEAVPVLYPMLHDAAAAIGARDASDRAFPTWEGTGGGSGDGVVIAFLDTGINDAPDGNYPGHESLVGRCVGGAVFLSGDSALDTPRAGSVNPVDRGGALTSSHGTHVASIALGTGGPAAYAVGIAPAARFVDVKVIGDAGVGTGVAEALDWCISNRHRDWGVANFEGIDVINLSLSSVDVTDGQDLASQLANRAVAEGVVVIASIGNEGASDRVPSPGGADRVIAVGAIDHQRTPDPSDDLLAHFSNYGPRASDGDLNGFDEQKPDVLAPGVAILAADGDLSSAGDAYKRMSGTSMSAAFVSGAAAALLSSYPGTSASSLAELLRATAYRQLSEVPQGKGGPDPRWSSPIGYGAIDLYAARLEMEQPTRSQITRLELTGSVDRIDAVILTQREFGPVSFIVERAPDQGGAPGAFSTYDVVAGTGDSSLNDPDNRRAYARQWSVPLAERGSIFWYRVTAYEQGGQRFETPSRAFTSPIGPSVASVELTLVHNAFDTDVNARVIAGPAAKASRSGLASPSGAPPLFVLPVPGSTAAVASDWVDGSSATGNIAWSFRLEVPPGVAEQCLPPRTDCPWRLEVEEGGYLNRSGRITAFDVVWHSPQGDVVYEGGPLPQQTLEGHTTRVWSPSDILAVDDAARAGASLGPNPVRSGNAVTFTTGATRTGDVRIFDLTGREIGRSLLQPWGALQRARWAARGPDGSALAPGVYFASIGSGPRHRLVILR